MQIIISPTKQMKTCDDDNISSSTPLMIEKTNALIQHLQSLSFEEIKAYMKCSDKIAQHTIQMLQNYQSTIPTNAIYAYTGIQFQYMAPHVFNNEENKYIQDHLWILSGLYGILHPFDGIKPYRLEMQTKCPFSLYEYWKDEIAKQLKDEPILNLASEEYAKVIRKYRKVIDVRFCQRKNGKLKETSVYAKMARGSMVRYLAQNNIQTIEQVKEFNELHYEFSKENSTDTLLTFIQTA